MARPRRRPVVPPISHSSHSLSERLGRVEVAVENLHADFIRVTDALEDLASSVSRGKETNWTLVLSGSMLVVALYAAAISPVKADIERQAVVDASLLATIGKFHDEFDGVKDLQIAVRARLDALEIINSELRNTVPSMDRRVALLELKTGLLSTVK